MVTFNGFAAARIVLPYLTLKIGWGDSMLCSDPFLSYLKSYGYSVIRLPRVDVAPLQLLVQQGRNLDRLGDITTVFVPGPRVGVPPLRPDVPAASISGQRTGDLSIGVGLSILGSVLGAMGASTLGLDVTYKRAKMAAFEFGDVTEDTVEVAKLDQFLSDADVNPLSRHVSSLLEADDIFVTTATIKSQKFTVEAKASSGEGLEISVPEIQDVVGANAKVTADASTRSKITYAGSVPLVFGFQAIRLFYEDGRYTAFEPLTAGTSGMKGLERVPDDGTTRLVSSAAFVRLGTG